MRKQHPSIELVGRLIRSRREAMGVSQDDFAAMVNLDRAYYSHVERGRYNITLEVLFRIAVGLGCTPAELMPEASELTNLPATSRTRGRRKLKKT
ncbi:helix-turn-helix domain-containing protein [Hydrocarboniphaga effusa]|jgi:transcriptional regulator with XRE-family HTH domain|uniref:helix-turn-helix domain-containing protein n=1 Tax=Hydrocarboniphaga effusa TaxID=243629 RepID=UPI00398BF6CA